MYGGFDLILIPDTETHSYSELHTILLAQKAGEESDWSTWLFVAGSELNIMSSGGAAIKVHSSNSSFSS